MHRRRRLLSIAAAALALATACRGAGRSDSVENEPAGRERPVRAWDVTEDGTLEPEPPVAVWIHYHQMDLPYHTNRTAHEPMAPEGTTRANLVAVPGCRCGEAVLSLLGDEIHLPDRAITLPLSGRDSEDVPEVKTELRGGTVWAWVDRARAGIAYTIYVTVDPPDAMAADAFAVVTRGEFAKYPVRAPIRAAAGRFIRIESMRHLELPSR